MAVTYLGGRKFCDAHFNYNKLKFSLSFFFFKKIALCTYTFSATQEDPPWIVKKGKQNYTGFTHLLRNICFAFPCIEQFGHDKPCLSISLVILKALSLKGLE